MDTFRPTRASRQKYIQRQLRTMNTGDGAVFGAGKVLGEAGGLGADFVRHAVTVLGVAGLVGIAVGALTDAPLYHMVFNWIAAWFA